jgi:predicted  nucleic acid-binding Zn ribbon protein
MHVHRIWFRTLAAPLADEEVAADAILSLLGAWRMNGQVCGGEWAIVRDGAGYSTTVMAPEAESLATRFERRYVKQALQRLREARFDVQSQSLGKDPSAGGACECATPSAYALFTTFLTLESAVKCMDCFRPVALHRFEPTANEEFHDLICWQSDYQACDSLQMNCRVLENSATRELTEIDSSLTHTGRELCATLARSSGRPFYYYLYRAVGDSHEAEATRACPICGETWRLATPLHDLFDFKCDRCHLLSNIAFDLRY